MRILSFALELRLRFRLRSSELVLLLLELLVEVELLEELELLLEVLSRFFRPEWAFRRLPLLRPRCWRLLLAAFEAAVRLALVAGTMLRAFGGEGERSQAVIRITSSDRA